MVHVDSIGTVAPHGALDHARMYATALAHMVPPPIWAHRSYLRPILEMSRDSIWLFDPVATVADRIQRSLRLEKASAHKYQEAAEDLGPALEQTTQNMKARIHKIDAYARTRKWSLGNVKVPWLADHVDLVCGNLPGSLGGIALYLQLSATLHGDMWALVQALEEIDADPGTGHRLGGLVISGDKVVQSLAFAGASVEAATRMRLSYYGLEPPDALTEAYKNFAHLWLLRWNDMERRGTV